MPFSFTNYLNQPDVKYKGNNSDGLAQIFMQKYLAYARNSGLQAYYQWRRTGVPTFSTGPAMATEVVIPRRFQYPTNENTAIRANYTSRFRASMEAMMILISIMWLLK